MQKMQKCKQFIKKQGYYIALCLVLTLVVTSGDIQRSRKEHQEQQALANQEARVASQVVKNVPKPTLAPNLTAPTPTPAPAVTPALPAKGKEAASQQTTQVSQTPAPTPEPTPKPVQPPILPAKGEVLKPFSRELLYSETLKDWRAHLGIDYKGSATDPVYAAADGVVEKVYTDGAMGITIVIDHQNGFKTWYQNLSTDKMVKEGQTVRQGDTISGMGETAICEMADGPHLHYAVEKDGELCNPADFK